MIRQASITSYLRGLSMLCIEVAAEPTLLPTFVKIIAMVPRTVEALRSRRVAA